MRTGIVILNYNDSESVIKLTDNIVDYSALGHIVIVDNMSTDNSLAVLTEKYALYDKVSVVSSGKNGGYSYGNNFGAEILIRDFSAEVVFIANPDVLFEESLITSICSSFEENKEYGVLSGVMTNPDGTTDAAPYRDFFTYMHDLGDCFISIRRLVYEKQKFEVDYSVPLMRVPVIQGSFFAIRSDVFKQIDGLDENVFLYCEELILGKRLQQAGYLTGLVTSEKYIHNHAVSIRKSMKNIAVWKTVLKSKYYYQKNYNGANFWQLILLRLCGGFSLFEKILVELIRQL